MKFTRDSLSNATAQLLKLLGIQPEVQVKAEATKAEVKRRQTDKFYRQLAQGHMQAVFSDDDPPEMLPHERLARFCQQMQIRG